MNNTVKSFVIFALGVGIGAVGTTIIIKDKYERLVQEEIASVRETRIRNYPDREKEDKVLVLPRDKYKRIVRNYNGMSDVEASNAIADPAELEHPMDDGEEYENYSKISDNANHKDDSLRPYVISIEEFSEEMNHFDKLTILYYEDDDTLADEGEEIIADVEGTVGTDNLTHFGENSDDPDIVYVRNENIQIDYEIIRLPKSYSKTVLGYRTEESRGHKVKRGEVVEE
jgi:hypothetical protein